MDRKIRVAAVSYLNAKPLTYGFEQGMMKDEVELSFDFPAKVAQQLLDNTIDIALVPVAIIPTLHAHEIIADHCISAYSEVASVCIFSDSPLNEIKEIYLDYQSRSSVALLEILMQRHWKISPLRLPASPGYETKIKNATAGLVIGDRALELRDRFKYVYDLAIAWRELTGFPAVFAAWVSNKKLDTGFVERFSAATAAGMEHLKEIAAANPFPAYDLYHYYTENIDYKLNSEKRESLALFLKLLAENY